MKQHKPYETQTVRNFFSPKEKIHRNADTFPSEAGEETDIHYQRIYLVLAISASAIKQEKEIRAKLERWLSG